MSARPCRQATTSYSAKPCFAKAFGNATNRVAKAQFKRCELSTGRFRFKGRWRNFRACASARQPVSRERLHANGPGATRTRSGDNRTDAVAAHLPIGGYKGSGLLPRQHCGINRVRRAQKRVRRGCCCGAGCDLHAALRRKSCDRRWRNAAQRRSRTTDQSE